MRNLNELSMEARGNDISATLREAEKVDALGNSIDNTTKDMRFRIKLYRDVIVNLCDMMEEWIVIAGVSKEKTRWGLEPIRYIMKAMREHGMKDDTVPTKAKPDNSRVDEESQGHRLLSKMVEVSRATIDDKCKPSPDQALEHILQKYYLNDPKQKKALDQIHLVLEGIVQHLSEDLKGDPGHRYDRVDILKRHVISLRSLLADPHKKEESGVNVIDASSLSPGELVGALKGIGDPVDKKGPMETPHVRNLFKDRYIPDLRKLLAGNFPKKRKLTQQDEYLLMFLIPEFRPDYMTADFVWHTYSRWNRDGKIDFYYRDYRTIHDCATFSLWNDKVPVYTEPSKETE